MTPAVSGKWLLALAGGFVVWSAAFVVLYSAVSIGCHQGWDQVYVMAGLSLQRAQLLVLYGLHLLAGLGLVFPFRNGPAGSRPASFLQTVSFYAAVAAVFCTTFTFAGILMLTSC